MPMLGELTEFAQSMGRGVIGVGVGVEAIQHYSKIKEERNEGPTKTANKYK